MENAKPTFEDQMKRVKKLEAEIKHHRKIVNDKRKELTKLRRTIAGEVAVELGLKRKRKRARKSTDEMESLCDAMSSSSVESE
eukprot:COSAG01_NODE_2206_length_8170_cov_70.537108_7_plen_83_part_00